MKRSNRNTGEGHGFGALPCGCSRQGRRGRERVMRFASQKHVKNDAGGQQRSSSSDKGAKNAQNGQGTKVRLFRMMSKVITLSMPAVRRIRPRAGRPCY